MALDKPTFFQKVFFPGINEQIDEIIAVRVKEQVSATYAEGSGRYTYLGGYSYNGEKNLGEMGPVKGYNVDYSTLRQRSWDLYLDSEIAQTVINKYVAWVIGKGLKLQAEPEQNILKQEGITIDKESWSRLIEARWAVWANSKQSDYSSNNSLNDLESEAFKTAIVGGDVLVIVRYIDNTVKIQLIDGEHVVTPPGQGSEIHPNPLANGNKIYYGVEISPSGEHVAYHIRKPGITIETERIQAKGKSGRTYAFMFYGRKYRIDSVRGLPLLASVMETSKKLERYKEATVGSAEERQKIAYTIEHEHFSTGENPLLNQTVKAYDLSRSTQGDYPTDDQLEALADKIAATTQKQTYNMPKGAKMVAVESKNELYFKDFYLVNVDIICAACEIPPNVAMSKYDSNFSASRAALKDWENTLNVKRSLFSRQFMHPIYSLFLDTEVMKNKIDSPGYTTALAERNYMLLEAYRTTRFIGAAVPHIDPVKEVTAERLKLGKAAEHVPLTTVEKSTEMINGGDSESNIEQFSNELKKTESLGIKMPETKEANQRPAQSEQ